MSLVDKNSVIILDFVLQAFCSEEKPWLLWLKTAVNKNDEIMMV